MVKILSKKRYEELIDIEDKYNHLIGQTFTIFTGERSRYKGLLSLSKEELVRIIFETNDYIKKEQKKQRKKEKKKWFY